ncbi:cytochrome c-type biogenesis protein [Salinivibrio kushneri]|uniref:Cytochrome c-type biogenesis protein n=1 Tax=Salinivibrio kushneri TaxID=1908198 RepID=A0AA47KJC3_9GAMM|nr:cytochrome c-type biogenesis protein [Salinivibrio kushneri]WBA08046.1 cytochrome c-type biogenesis protein CcmH [Salinivibrio kushneri]
MKRLILLGALWLSVSLAFANAIDVYKFDSAEQEARFRALTSELRCPKCQNNSIADSNAELAQDLRQKVHQMLQQGRTDEEIRSFMIARYGNFVTYNPPVTASTLILWLAPALVLVSGMVVMIMRSRRAKQTVNHALSDEEEQRLNALLSSTEGTDDSPVSTSATNMDTSADQPASSEHASTQQNKEPK